MDEQGIVHHPTKYPFKKANQKRLKELHDRLVYENRISLKRQIGILIFLAMIIFGALYFFLLTY